MITWGDAYDLLNNKDFIEDYEKVAQLIIKLKTEQNINVVEGRGIHPARKSKMICSIRYFDIIQDEKNKHEK